MEEIKSIYARLKAENFDAYLADDPTLVFFDFAFRKNSFVRYLEDDRIYLLGSTDGMQVMSFDSKEKLFETIFFVSHCL